MPLRKRTAILRRSPSKTAAAHYVAVPLFSIPYSRFPAFLPSASSPHRLFAFSLLCLLRALRVEIAANHAHSSPPRLGHKTPFCPRIRFAPRATPSRLPARREKRETLHVHPEALQTAAGQNPSESDSRPRESDFPPCAHIDIPPQMAYKTSVRNSTARTENDKTMSNQATMDSVKSQWGGSLTRRSRPGRTHSHGLASTRPAARPFGRLHSPIPSLHSLAAADAAVCTTLPIPCAATGSTVRAASLPNLDISTAEQCEPNPEPRLSTLSPPQAPPPPFAAFRRHFADFRRSSADPILPHSPLCVPHSPKSARLPAESRVFLDFGGFRQIADSPRPPALLFPGPWPRFPVRKEPHHAQSQ